MLAPFLTTSPRGRRTISHQINHARSMFGLSVEMIRFAEALGLTLQPDESRLGW